MVLRRQCWGCGGGGGGRSGGGGGFLAIFPEAEAEPEADFFMKFRLRLQL